MFITIICPSWTILNLRIIIQIKQSNLIQCLYFLNNNQYSISNQSIKINKLKINMSQPNNSLIGFLKKKSLFSDSPAKSFQFKQRSKSKSKNNLASTIRQIKISPQNQFKKINTQSSRDLMNLKAQNYKESAQSQQGHQTVQIQRKNLFNNSFHNSKLNQTTLVSPKRNFNIKGTTSESKSYWRAKQEQNTNLWTGLVNYSTSFQSARLESAQCLQGMSIKLQAELSNIDYKIESFHIKMTQMLNNQFEGMKQKIYSIVDKVFQQSQHIIRAYIKQQQQILAHELIAMKNNLIKQYQKIDNMKVQINKSHWKKVTGQLLSSQLQQNIQKMLQKSRSINVGSWEIGDLGVKKVSYFQNILRQMIKLNSK